MRTYRLERHPHGTYYLRVKGRRFNCGRNFKEAGKKAKEYLRQIASGQIVLDGIETTKSVTRDGKRDISVAELAHLHLEWVMKHRSTNTYIVRKRFANYFVRFVGPTTMVSQLSYGNIDDFHTMAREQHGHGPNGGNHAVREIKTMLRWGQDAELCELPFKRPYILEWEKPAPKPFSLEELVKLHAKLPQDFADLSLFATLTGLRPRELRELVRSHIIEKQLPGPDGQIESRLVVMIARHKTARTASGANKKPRMVPLCGTAEAIVRKLMAKHPKSDYIFLNEDGKPYERTALRKRLIRWCRRAGIPERSPYSWRHTFASFQADWGTNQGALQQLMGHARPETTMGYLGNCGFAHRQAVDMMEGVMLNLLAKSKQTAESVQKPT